MISSSWFLCPKLSRFVLETSHRYVETRDYFGSFVPCMHVRVCMYVCVCTCTYFDVCGLRGVQWSIGGGRSLRCLLALVHAAVTVSTTATAAATSAAVSHRRAGRDGG